MGTNTNQLSIFDDAKFAETSKSFVAGRKTFREFGQETLVETQDDIPYFVNEFRTAGQRQAHSIHEVSCRACFKAQLPEFLI